MGNAGLRSPGYRDEGGALPQKSGCWCHVAPQTRPGQQLYWPRRISEGAGGCLPCLRSFLIFSNWSCKRLHLCRSFLRAFPLPAKRYNSTPVLEKKCLRTNTLQSYNESFSSSVYQMPLSPRWISKWCYSENVCHIWATRLSPYFH